jgi:ABC-2 type transport system permease protein
MLRRILAATMRDIKSGIRDSMIIYILIAPILIALIMRAFIPAAGSSVINVAVIEGTDPAFVEMLKEHGRVEVLNDRADIIKRVEATDDIFGLIAEDDQIEIIAGGNEMTGGLELVKSVIGSWQNPGLEVPAEVEISDMDWQLSPLGQYGSNFLVVFMSVFGGIVVMLNLVEEKQYKTLAAVNVSPVRRWEYVAGKSIPGIILPIFHSFITLLILGFTNINYWQVAAVTISIALISLIIGFVIGIYQSEPIGAVSSMKITFLPIIGSIFGAIFLAEKWHPLLYWSPFYWAFKSVDQIILGRAKWSEIWLNNGIILLITVLVFLVMQKRIRRGMIST